MMGLSFLSLAQIQLERLISYLCETCGTHYTMSFKGSRLWNQSQQRLQTPHGGYVDSAHFTRTDAEQSVCPVHYRPNQFDPAVKRVVKYG